MRQAITIALRTVLLEHADEPPAPGHGEALLAVASVGICGSDIAMWDGSDPYARFPVRQGHEFSARILAFGPGYVGALAIGQLVAVEPLLPDGTCIACRRSRPNCCVGLEVIGSHVDGALADLIIVPISNLFSAAGLTPDQAAFVEPISIALQMVSRSGLGVGDKVVIFGAGPIGQAIQVVARDRGARLLSVDIVPGRLERAQANGAEVVVDGRADDVAGQIAAWTDRDGPVVVFEATGVAAVVRQAIEVVANSGTVVVAGTPTNDVSLPALSLVKKEIDLLGSRNNAGLYPAAVNMVQRYQQRCEALITQRFGLDEVQAAMEFGASYPALANKMMIQVAG